MKLDHTGGGLKKPFDRVKGCTFELSGKHGLLYSIERLRESRVHGKTLYSRNLNSRFGFQLNIQLYTYRVAEDELRADGPVEPADVGGVPEPRVDAVRHQPVVLTFSALKAVRQ